MKLLISTIIFLLAMNTVNAKPSALSCSQLWEDLQENAKSINLLENLCFEIENADDKYNCYESVYRYKRDWLQATKEYNLVCPENK